MFWHKKAKKEILIFSPCKGKVIKLSDVKDSVFSAKILGDGIAILPKSENFYAPMTGKLTVLFPTGHAFGIKSNIADIELLIHIGFDTSTSKLKLYSKVANVDDMVEENKTLIVKAHLDEIKKNNFDTVTPIIVTSDAKEKYPDMIIKCLAKPNSEVEKGDLLLKITI